MHIRFIKRQKEIFFGCQINVNSLIDTLIHKAQNLYQEQYKLVCTDLLGLSVPANPRAGHFWSLDGEVLI